MNAGMNQILGGFVKDGVAAGVSALVYKRGKEAYFGAFGEADRDTHAPFTRDTLVRIYSMSKIVTAVTALSYMEKGLFKLDDPISRYMPEYADTKIAAADASDTVHMLTPKNPITFRHLFTMTSGIPYPGGGETAASRAVGDAYRAMYDGMQQRSAGGERVTTADYARAIAACPLCFEPGTRWLYGLSIDVLGGLICAMTGLTLYEAMREAVLDKLNMKDTCFSVPEEKAGRLATIYARDEKNAMVVFTPGEECGEVESGGGGLISSIDDMMRFARMLLGEGELEGKRVLSKASIAEMVRPQFDRTRVPGFDWESERGFAYGLGVRTMCEPAQSEYDEPAGAFGWNGMAGTSLRVSPADGQAAVFFVQNLPAWHEVFLPPFVRAARAL